MYQKGRLNQKPPTRVLYTCCMEIASEIFAGLLQLLVALLYLMVTPVGALLLSIVALLVLDIIYLAVCPGE